MDPCSAVMDLSTTTAEVRLSQSWVSFRLYNGDKNMFVRLEKYCGISSKHLPDKF